MVMLELEFIRRRRIPWLGLAFLMATTCWCAVEAGKWCDLSAIVQDNQEHVASIEHSLKEARRMNLLAQTNISPAVAQRLKDHAAMVAALRYPWSQVLATMERGSTKEVAILALTHEQGAGGTQLTVEAAGLASLTGYVKKMNEIDHANRWYLANYQIQYQNNPVTVKATILEK